MHSCSLISVKLFKTKMLRKKAVFFSITLVFMILYYKYTYLKLKHSRCIFKFKWLLAVTFKALQLWSLYFPKSLYFSVFSKEKSTKMGLNKSSVSVIFLYLSQSSHSFQFELLKVLKIGISVNLSLQKATTTLLKEGL
jgi:hypothetical protein